MIESWHIRLITKFHRHDFAKNIREELLQVGHGDKKHRLARNRGSRHQNFKDRW